MSYYVTILHREDGTQIEVRSRPVIGGVTVISDVTLTPDELARVEDDVRLQVSEGWVPEPDGWEPVPMYPYDEAARLPGEDRG